MISTFDTINITPSAINVPVPYISELFSADGLLWILEPNLRLFYSADNGNTWTKALANVSSVFHSPNFGLYLCQDNVVSKCTIQNNVAELQEISRLPIGNKTYAFAIRGDTVVATAESSNQFLDSLIIVRQNNVFKRLGVVRRPKQFYQLSDGSLCLLSHGGDMCIQYPSVSDGFHCINSSLGVVTSLSASYGRIRDSTVVMTVGIDKGNFRKRDVAQIGPAGTRFNVFQIDSLLQSKYFNASLQDGSLTMLSESGQITQSTSRGLRSSNPKIADSLSQTDFALVAGPAPWSVTRTLTYDGTMHQFLFTSPLTFSALCGGNTTSFRDSLGALKRLFKLSDGSSVLVSANGCGLLENQSGLGVRSLSYPGIGDYSVPFNWNLSDQSLLLPLYWNGYCRSTDLGQTWRKFVVPKMIQTYSQFHLHGNGLVLNSSSAELIFISDPFKTDTAIVSSRFQRRNLKILGYSSDSVFAISAPSTDISSGPLTQMILYTLKVGAVLDSTIVTLSKPFPGLPRITTAKFSDTVIVFEKYTSRHITIVNGVVQSDVLPPIGLLSRVDLTPQADIFIPNTSQVTIAFPTAGVLVDYFPFRHDSTLSTVQDIAHVYVQDAHPNPTKGTVSVTIGKFVTADVSSISLELYDTNGQLIRNFSNKLPKFGSGNEQESVTLDVSGIQNGMYLLVIRNAQTTQATKVIIL
ncbi:MAG: T9SS type A sorting domain-containing protein [Ignavibacteria bacterium]|nr:T9SS type A sorting domain-containing protein [Ignavibacteria bacterium]